MSFNAKESSESMSFIRTRSTLYSSFTVSNGRSLTDIDVNSPCRHAFTHEVRTP
jgi:hypothetical protein